MRLITFPQEKQDYTRDCHFVNRRVRTISTYWTYQPLHADEVQKQTEDIKRKGYEILDIQQITDSFYIETAIYYTVPPILIELTLKGE